MELIPVELIDDDWLIIVLLDDPYDVLDVEEDSEVLRVEMECVVDNNIVVELVSLVDDLVQIVLVDCSEVLTEVNDSVVDIVEDFDDKSVQTMLVNLTDVLNVDRDSEIVLPIVVELSPVELEYFEED